MYHHFLLLHSAYRIFLSTASEAEKADEMIRTFVETFPVLYGRSSVTYNVHNLLHIKECVEKFGALDNFSAYYFENYMQTIKRNIRMPKHLCQQIFNSFKNAPLPLKNQFLGLQFKDGHPKSITLYKGFFSTKEPDNVCLTKNKTFLKITKILNEEEFEAKPFGNIRSFFKEPIDSSQLNIVVAEEDDGAWEIVYRVHEIQAKVVKLPYENSFVLIPELHSYY